MNETCTFHDYVRWNLFERGKYYRARVWQGLHLRSSRKRLKTATQAQEYGQRWAARYNRLRASCGG